ncbi:DUF3526 domain-containing protein [Limibacter armeniacum]|uniref:ABC transporter permease n=1 Tax=Limibacter armeniacum TaxID=466084 RepID=UPI002FE694F0
MWQIIKNEWHFLIRTSAFLRISIGFLLTLLLAVYLGNLQFDQQEIHYQIAKDHLRAQWEDIDEMNPHSAAHYGTYVFKPVNLSSSLDEGIYCVTGNVLRVEGHVQNEVVHSEASQMQAVSRFGKLKSALLLQYILPLLLVFLAFHSVSSEKQSGRLKLLILQGAKLSSLVWAKALSVWLYGIGLLTLTVWAYAFVNLTEISTEVMVRTLFFYLSYGMYYFIVSTLTIYLSARWQNATVALTSMLGIWILWTVFLPNILMSAVESWYELPSRNVFQAAMKEDRSKGLDGHNPADDRTAALEEKVLKQYGVDTIAQLPINFDGILMQADEEYGNQVWDKHFGNLRTTLRLQKQRYQLAGIINPFISLQNASMGFAASDNLHHHEFLVQAENYRRDLIKALNNEHAYGGSRTGDWSWKANNDFFRSIPDFEYKPVALVSVYSHYAMDMAMMVVWVLFVSGLLFVGTQKIQIL